jgi:ESS family glutamate:Na+ symporter
MTAVVNDLSVLMVFLLFGFALREIIKPLQKLFLPAGLIGGILALILGPQVLNLIVIPEGWAGMSSPMINVVLTCMIFGTVISRDKVKNFASSIVIIALTYFAQLAVGTLAGLGLSKIWTGLPEGWGVMSVFTYWGGHGAGASSGQLFEDLGVPGMLSMGIVLSTLGLIVAMVIGMILVNIGVRKGYANYLGNVEGSLIKTVSGPLPKEKQKSLGNGTVAPDAINGLAMQLALVLLSMWLGTKLFSLLTMAVPSASNIPSLLYGIVGALIVWGILRAVHLDGYADKKAIDNISGVALEICICSATATLNLQMFLENLAPILIHMVIIILLMVFICMVLVKRWLKKDWLETALLFFGQGTGSSPSGLALARCTDPETKNSTAWEGFGVAVGVFSPLSSTLVAILPVLTVQSVWVPIGIGTVVTIVCLIFGELVIRRQN